MKKQDSNSQSSQEGTIDDDFYSSFLPKKFQDPHPFFVQIQNSFHKKESNEDCNGRRNTSTDVSTIPRKFSSTQNQSPIQCSQKKSKKNCKGKQVFYKTTIDPFFKKKISLLKQSERARSAIHGSKRNSVRSENYNQEIPTLLTQNKDDKIIDKESPSFSKFARLKTEQCRAFSSVRNSSHEYSEKEQTTEVNPVGVRKRHLFRTVFSSLVQQKCNESLNLSTQLDQNIILQTQLGQVHQNSNQIHNRALFNNAFLVKKQQELQDSTGAQLPLKSASTGISQDEVNIKLTTPKRGSKVEEEILSKISTKYSAFPKNQQTLSNCLYPTFVNVNDFSAVLQFYADPLLNNFPSSLFLNSTLGFQASSRPKSSRENRLRNRIGSKIIQGNSSNNELLNAKQIPSPQITNSAQKQKTANQSLSENQSKGSNFVQQMNKTAGINFNISKEQSLDYELNSNHKNNQDSHELHYLLNKYTLPTTLLKFNKPLAKQNQGEASLELKKPVLIKRYQFKNPTNHHSQINLNNRCKSQGNTMNSLF